MSDSSDESTDNFIEAADTPRKSNGMQNKDKKKLLGIKSGSAAAAASKTKSTKTKTKKSLGDTPKPVAAAAPKKKAAPKRAASQMEEDEYNVSAEDFIGSSSSSSSSAAAAAAAAPPAAKRRQTSFFDDIASSGDASTTEVQEQRLVMARTRVQRLLNAEHFDYAKLDDAYQKLTSAYLLRYSGKTASKKSNNARLRACRSLAATVRRLNQMGVEAMGVVAVHTSHGQLKCYGSPRFESMVRHPNFTAMARTVFTEKRHHRVTYESPPPIAIVPDEPMGGGGGIDDCVVSTSVVTPFYKAAIQNSMTIRDQSDLAGSWNKTPWKKPRRGDEFLNTKANERAKKKLDDAAAAAAAPVRKKKPKRTDDDDGEEEDEDEDEDDDDDSIMSTKGSDEVVF